MKHYETLLKTMKHYEALLKTMKHYETLLKTMKHYETLLKTMKRYETLLKTMKRYETLLNTIYPLSLLACVTGYLGDAPGELPRVGEMEALRSIKVEFDEEPNAP